MLNKMTNLAYSYCEESSFFDPCNFDPNYNSLDHGVLPYDLYDLDDNAFDLLDCPSPIDNGRYGSGVDDIFGVSAEVEGARISPLPSSDMKIRKRKDTNTSLLSLPESPLFYDSIDIKTIFTPNNHLLKSPDNKAVPLQQTFDLSQLIMHFEQHLDNERDDFRRSEDIRTFQQDLDNYLTSNETCPLTSRQVGDDVTRGSCLMSPSTSTGGSLSSSLSSHLLSPSLLSAATAFDFSDLLGDCLGDVITPDHCDVVDSDDVSCRDLPLQAALLDGNPKSRANSSQAPLLKKEKGKAGSKVPQTTVTDTERVNSRPPSSYSHMDDHDYCRYVSHGCTDPSDPRSNPLSSETAGPKKTLTSILPKRPAYSNGSKHRVISLLTGKTHQTNNIKSEFVPDSTPPATLMHPDNASLKPSTSSSQANQRLDFKSGRVRLVSLLGATANRVNPNGTAALTGKDNQIKRRKRQISLNNNNGPSPLPVNPAQRLLLQQQKSNSAYNATTTSSMAKKCRPTIVTLTNGKGEVRILAQSNMPPPALPRNQVIAAGVVPASGVKQEFDPDAFEPTQPGTCVESFLDTAAQELDNDFLAYLLNKEDGEGDPTAHVMAPTTSARNNETTIGRGGSSSRETGPPKGPTSTTSHVADKQPPSTSNKKVKTTPQSNPQRAKVAASPTIAKTSGSARLLHNATPASLPPYNEQKCQSRTKFFPSNPRNSDLQYFVKKEPTSSSLFSSWNDMTTLVDLDLKTPSATNPTVRSVAPTTRANSTASIKSVRLRQSQLSPEKEDTPCEDQECGSVKVDGISDSLGLGDVKGLFKKFGPIKNVVINASTTHRYAVVTYNNKRDAMTAVRRGSHIAGNTKFEVSLFNGPSYDGRDTNHQQRQLKEQQQQSTSSGTTPHNPPTKPCGTSPNPERRTVPPVARTLRSCRSDNTSPALLLCS